VGEGVSIEIDDLWMRYRDNLDPVLQGVSLQVRPGEKVAIVGKTGSGKTSLVQALFRLYPLERGSIRIGGYEAAISDENPAALDLKAYRGLLSFITQDATLFLGTIRENLAGPGAKPETRSSSDAISDFRMIEALRRVQFLRPDATESEYAYWLDYQVEERGRNLSAGERQLICMARCLLQDSPVVIFDEATSAVDPQSERILHKATEEYFRGKTMLLIAHRLSTIRFCDRVLWLQNGKIHRLGRPEEVLPDFEAADLTV